MLLNLLTGIAALAVFVVPGIAVALTWSPTTEEQSDGPLWHIALGLGWGFGLVPFIAFCWALFTMDPLTPWTTITAAVVVTVCAGWWWWSCQGRRLPLALKKGWRSAFWVLLACAGVGLIYFLKYDRSIFFLESCIHRVVMQTLQLTDNTIDILASNQDDQRLGNTSVISSFVVLFRGMGFRVLYGFVGFIIALGGYLLGCRLFGKKWAWFILFAGSLNPYVAKIPLLDENLLTYGYASLMLPLLLRRSVPWGHIGALFGLAVMMRHTGILCLGAIIYALVQTKHNRRAATLWFLLTFNLVTVVAHIHHYVALGSIFKFESFGQIPEFQHRFLGEYSGLLQWPFADHILRTPWNPFPTFLMWPVYIADHLGLVLFAGLLLGGVYLYRAQKTEGIFWLLWFFPTYLALSVQENWDVPNKMGVIYVLFHPLIIWSVAGLKSAFESPRRWGVALVGLAFLCGFGVKGLRAYHAPEDVRYYQAWPGEREEDFAYVSAERERVTDVAPWPDFGRIGPFSRTFRKAKLTGLLRDISDVSINLKSMPYGWFENESVEPNAPSVNIRIDLSQRLFDRSDPFVTLVGQELTPDVDLTANRPPVVIPNLNLSWSPRPVSVLFTPKGSNISGATLIFERWGDDKERQDYLHERYHRGLMMVMGLDENALYEFKPLEHTDASIVVRVPSGPFSFVENINNAGQNYLFWRNWLSRDTGVEVNGPYRVFHN